MNNDLLQAKSALNGHTIALCKGDTLIVCDKKSIRPMLDFISEGKDLSGFSAADLVVGKAVATLFVYAKIKCVYSKVMSRPALEYLQSHGIDAKCDTLVENIINRAGDGICPMEQCVQNIDDASVAYAALKDKIMQMQRSVGAKA